MIEQVEGEKEVEDEMGGVLEGATERSTPRALTCGERCREFGELAVGAAGSLVIVVWVRFREALRRGGRVGWDDQDWA